MIAESPLYIPRYTRTTEAQIELVESVQELTSDILSPIELITGAGVPPTETQLPELYGTDIAGRMKVGEWIGARIVKRFSSDPLEVLTAPGGSASRLGEAVLWTDRSSLVSGATILNTAAPDNARELLHEKLRRNSKVLTAKRRLDALEARDISEHVLLLDRLQASYAARIILQKMGVEPLQPQDYSFIRSFTQMDTHILPSKEVEKEGVYTKINDLDDLDQIVARDVESYSTPDAFDYDRFILLNSIVKSAQLAFGVENVQLFRAKSPSLGTEPYYVTEISVCGTKLAIAETPIRDNATYIISEAEAAGTWEEVLSLTKVDARGVGAHALIHGSADETYQNHFNRISRWLKLQTESLHS